MTNLIAVGFFLNNRCKQAENMLADHTFKSFLYLHNFNSKLGLARKKIVNFNRPNIKSCKKVVSN